MSIIRNIRMERCLMHANKMLTELSSDRQNWEMEKVILASVGERYILGQIEEVMVTEAGFVTMAILPSHGKMIGDVTVVPGVDDLGQRGNLILSPKSPPFHSLNQNMTTAVAEARESYQKSNELVKQFGGKSAMYSAVAKAPLLLVSRYEDFEQSGLCLWGAESFLRRIRLLAFARRFGLPRLLLKIAGSYGVRLTAAALLRRKKRFNLGQEHCNTERC